jgi:hypothetical protein
LSEASDDIAENMPGQAAFPMWRMHSAKIRDVMGVSRDFAPWTSRAQAKVQGVLHIERVLDLINVAWIDRLQKLKGQGLHLTAAADGFFVSIDQAVQRRPWGSQRTSTQGFDVEVLVI